MGALAFIGLLIGLFLWVKESMILNTPAANTRDLGAIMRDSAKVKNGEVFKRKMTRRINNGEYK